MGSPASEELRALIEYLARALVDLPNQVNVKQIEGEQTTVIELKVAKEDLGKVIGKQGRTARAIRTILNGASTKLKKRTVLEIIE
ncbi:MAG: KH domain-containing protein [Bdellovibrionota bacterium]